MYLWQEGTLRKIRLCLMSKALQMQPMQLCIFLESEDQVVFNERSGDLRRLFKCNLCMFVSLARRNSKESKDQVVFNEQSFTNATNAMMYLWQEGTLRNQKIRVCLMSEALQMQPMQLSIFGKKALRGDVRQMPSSQM